MSLRCGCKDEGDDIVFGPIHQCWPEGVAAANLSAEVRRLEAEEPRYMETLDESERRGH